MPIPVSATLIRKVPVWPSRSGVNSALRVKLLEIRLFLLKQHVVTFQNREIQNIVDQAEQGVSKKDNRIYIFTAGSNIQIIVLRATQRNQESS